MKRLVSAALLLLLVLALIPAQSGVRAQGAIQLKVTNEYTLNRYGYAVVNESVQFTNNGTSAVSVPDLAIGFGNLSSKVVAYNLTGSGFSVSAGGSEGGPYTVSGGGTIGPGASARYMLKALINGVTAKATNGTLEVTILSSPSLSLEAGSLKTVVRMPGATAFASPPTGLTQSAAGNYINYSSTKSNASPASASLVVKSIKQSTLQDFHPLKVFSASRTISAANGGTPMVTDKMTFRNLGTTNLQTLTVAPLVPPNSQVTILPAVEPRLLNPVRISLASYGIDLTNNAIGYPVPSGRNYTIRYTYPLDHKYYTVSGGQVTVSLPETPPIPAFVDSLAIGASLGSGVKLLQSPPSAITGVTPWQGGQTSLAYGLTYGWAINAGIPAASAIFVLLLVGLFVSRTTLSEEEETEEESSTERASAMIKAFEEKTSLINGLWSEIAEADPNELDKEHFDELRGRLDSFRSRALQRLNEVKQKSTTQKFFELLNQIHTTEREVDRAAKDKLNLYEQYYMKRMMKEVFDRLLTQYTKRLEKALNQLSDELHVVQREAKLL